MKTCPVCELKLADTYLYCPDDGSNLDSLSSYLSGDKHSNTTKLGDETGSAVVLYCPTCAAEYPLTFASCPVHGVPLTKHHIPKLTDGGLNLNDQSDGAHALRKNLKSRPRITNARSPLNDHSERVDTFVKTRVSKLTAPLTTLDLADVQASHEPLLNQVDLPVDQTKIDDKPKVDDQSGVDAAIYSNKPIAAGRKIAFDADAAFAADFGLPPASEANSQERAFDRPGYRIAAIATVVLLTVFAMVALYTFISNSSRRPSRTAKTEVAQSAAQPLPFVPTPTEARDYKEEATPTPPPPAEVDQAVESTPPVAERVRRESAPSLADQPRKHADNNRVPKAPAATSPVTTPTRVSVAPLPELPRGNSDGFDARLIRVRSRKTMAGVRYDLTFNMQEQAGRAANWQRVLVSTRSASGASHSQAIPFSHRLGAAGALTFTISVELTGRSEADWQGRVFCTTLGWDNKGAPLQARFGANITP